MFDVTIVLQDAQTREQLRTQIREQVREQVEAAREQVRAAQEQARIAQDEARIVTEQARTREVVRVQTPGGPAQGREIIMVPPRFPVQETIPHEAVVLGLSFFLMLAVMVIGLPIARAFARRMDRRPLPTPPNPELAAQLQRIEHAVEAMAIEVERISESQRYVARIQADRSPEPAMLASRAVGQ